METQEREIERVIMEIGGGFSGRGQGISVSCVLRLSARSQPRQTWWVGFDMSG